MVVMLPMTGIGGSSTLILMISLLMMPLRPLITSELTSCGYCYSFILPPSQTLSLVCNYVLLYVYFEVVLFQRNVYNL